MKALGVIVSALMLMVPTNGWCILGAGDVVHDPLSFIQHVKVEYNTLMTRTESARQTIAQINMLTNQARQIENQVRSLTFAAQNLRPNPMALLTQIQGLWQSYNQALTQAQGLTYNLAQAGAQFDVLYPKASAGMGGTVANLSAQATQMLEQIRQASRSAVQAQAVSDRLCTQQALSQDALLSAKAATGNLEIQQAQAQISALTNEQLASIQQIMAAQGRVETSYYAMEAQASQNAKEAAAAWMKDWPQPGVLRGPGQGQGAQLPQ